MQVRRAHRRAGAGREQVDDRAIVRDRVGRRGDAPERVATLVVGVEVGASRRPVVAVLDVVQAVLVGLPHLYPSARDRLAVGRPDVRDWSSLHTPTASFRDHLDDGVVGMRIAFSPGLGYLDVDPDVAGPAESAVEVLPSSARFSSRSTPASRTRCGPITSSGSAARPSPSKGCHRRSGKGGIRDCGESARSGGGSRRSTTSTPSPSGWRWAPGWAGSTNASTCPSLRPSRSALHGGPGGARGVAVARMDELDPFTCPFNLTQQPRHHRPLWLHPPGCRSACRSSAHDTPTHECVTSVAGRRHGM
jgi:hypothetical protein